MALRDPNWQLLSGAVPKRRLSRDKVFNSSDTLLINLVLLEDMTASDEIPGIFHQVS